MILGIIMNGHQRCSDDKPNNRRQLSLRPDDIYVSSGRRQKIVVIFWHLPSRSRAGKSRLYLNHRRRSQEELIPCDTQCFYSHLSPLSWNFATNRFELWNRRSRIFWMQQLRPDTKNFSGVVTPKKSAIHCNLSLFAINDKMLCNSMLPYFYLNSHIV